MLLGQDRKELMMATLAQTIERRTADPMSNVARLDADTAWAAFMRRDRAWDGRIIGAVWNAPLAPGVVAQALNHYAIFVGDDRDRAEVISVKVARRDRLRRNIGEAHADPDIADRQIIAPAGTARAGSGQLGHYPEGGKVERGAFA